MIIFGGVGLLWFDVVNYISRTIRGSFDVDGLLVARVLAKYTIGAVVCHTLSNKQAKLIECAIVYCISKPKMVLVIINIWVQT